MINRKYQRERSFSFITIAFLTLSSPGPGVLFTVTNSINYGVRTALFGISGLIIGMFIIAVISASGVGLIITSNPTIFTALKFIGAFYLMYLGYKILLKIPNSRLIRN